jgi:hypothetical protein
MCVLGEVIGCEAAVAVEIRPRLWNLLLTTVMQSVLQRYGFFKSSMLVWEFPKCILASLSRSWRILLKISLGRTIRDAFSGHWVLGLGVMGRAVGLLEDLEVRQPSFDMVAGEILRAPWLRTSRRRKTVRQVARWG